MQEVKIEIIENKALLLGDNHFETGAIELKVDEEVKAGAFLKRKSDSEFEVVKNTTSEEPVAISSVATKNITDKIIKVSIRACIDGRVRADMLNVNGTPANAAQIDMIRKFGLVPIYANDVSITG